MHFYHPEYLNGLWALPVLALLFYAARRIKNRQIAKLGILSTLLKISNGSPYKWLQKCAFAMLATALVIITLAQPQWGEEKKKVERKGVDIIFILDTSLSMLSQDIKPSRFQKAKMEIKSFVKKIKGDRVGLIAFAGSSFLQSPLTSDSAAFSLFLDALAVGYIPDPGSALSEAIETAIRAFPQDNIKHRVVILLSDGEFHGESYSEAVAAAAKAGLIVYSIGTGTVEGGPIPLQNDQKKIAAYKKDRNGQIIMTKLKADVLADISAKTGGLYYPSTPAEKEIDLIYADMQKIGKKSIKEQLIVEKEDHYQGFLLLALLFLVAEFLTQEIRRKKQNV